MDPHRFETVLGKNEIQSISVQRVVYLHLVTVRTEGAVYLVMVRIKLQCTTPTSLKGVKRLEV